MCDSVCPKSVVESQKFCTVTSVHCSHVARCNWYEEHLAKTASMFQNLPEKSEHTH